MNGNDLLVYEENHFSDIEEYYLTEHDSLSWSDAVWAHYTKNQGE